jgi:hypothetical protein
MLTVKAGDLADALKPAKPHPLKKKPKPVPVTLEQDSVSRAFSVIEARHGAFSKSIAASGDWPNPVQVEGLLLLQLATKWPAETELELSADEEALTIRAGKSTSRLARIDGGGKGGIKRKPFEPDKRHKGKVEVAPERRLNRVALADTWGFSARVPMPQHRDPDDKGN